MKLHKIAIKCFIYIFLIFLIFYNIFSTYLHFGSWLNIKASTTAIIRDWLRFFFIFIIWINNFKFTIKFLKQNKKTIFLLISLCLYSLFLSKIYYWKPFFEIAVWFKSIILAIFIFLSSIFLWTFIKQQKIFSKKTFNQFIKYLLRFILVFGIIIQLLKIFIPDLFLKLWYWPVGDRNPNFNPPIYYRTWPWWLTRLSGLFAWPNNFWYFLVLFLPFLIWLISTKNNNLNSKTISKTDIFLVSLFILNWILTLWRWVILGRIIELWLIIIFFKKYRTLLISIFKKNKKIILLISITLIIFLSFLFIKKIWSTNEHIAKRWEWINFIIQKPILWYWLGTSWPAFHYWWKIIPENFYFQIWIDLWIIWLILYFLTRIKIFKKYFWKTSQTKFIFIWILWLASVWAFLHILEDSMVNDLFFIISWIYIWLEYQESN